MHFSFFLSFCLLCSVPAYAGCSRVIQAPLSLMGLAIGAHETSNKGIYPNILHDFAPHCEFVTPIVPRSRLEQIFALGQTDILFPAIRSQKRDQFGIFVPLLQVRASLITLNEQVMQIKNAHELLYVRKSKVLIMRGVHYGEAYQAIVSELTRQNRVLYEADPVLIVRSLQAGMAELAILGSHVIIGAIQTDERGIANAQTKLHYQSIPRISLVRKWSVFIAHDPQSAR